MCHTRKHYHLCPIPPSQPTERGVEAQAQAPLLLSPPPLALPLPNPNANRAGSTSPIPASTNNHVQAPAVALPLPPSNTNADHVSPVPASTAAPVLPHGAAQAPPQPLLLPFAALKGQLSDTLCLSIAGEEAATSPKSTTSVPPVQAAAMVLPMVAASVPSHPKINLKTQRVSQSDTLCESGSPPTYDQDMLKQDLEDNSSEDALQHNLEDDSSEDDYAETSIVELRKLENQRDSDYHLCHGMLLPEEEDKLEVQEFEMEAADDQDKGQGQVQGPSGRR
ncbi:hypothetical protein B0H17DRAFT_1135956 [Mycena rosella]|uniref:Uncharacterized protein n=1 Tax=Mycena rosella TaxID=1033263 RepID=A0AAD7DCB9_MYCRO|nr:hypothetical protein B0H17DRAFT_1135956 [Mycena rosella]